MLQKTHFDVSAVIDKFGVAPELIVDYLSLVGDKIDNIPGVYKVGPKTAVKWLNSYGSLNGVVENATKIIMSTDLINFVKHKPTQKMAD